MNAILCLISYPISHISTWSILRSLYSNPTCVPSCYIPSNCKEESIHVHAYLLAKYPFFLQIDQYNTCHGVAITIVTDRSHHSWYLAWHEWHGSSFAWKGFYHWRSINQFTLSPVHFTLSTSLRVECVVSSLTWRDLLRTKNISDEGYCSSNRVLLQYTCKP